MSMPYKVYVFEYDRFYEELADILFRALTSNSEEELRSFIDQHFEILKHPYEGTPLESSWETEFAPISVQMLAEICLTKYFDPSDDHGLVYWIGLDDVLNSIEADLGEIILGHSFGPKDNQFNPGILGSYFQSPSETRETFAQLENIVANHKDVIDQEEGVAEDLDQVMTGFSKAVRMNQGVYVTF